MVDSPSRLVETAKKIKVQRKIYVLSRVGEGAERSVVLYTDRDAASDQDSFGGNLSSGLIAGSVGATAGLLLALSPPTAHLPRFRHNIWSDYINANFVSYHDQSMYPRLRGEWSRATDAFKLRTGAVILKAAMVLSALHVSKAALEPVLGKRYYFRLFSQIISLGRDAAYNKARSINRNFHQADGLEPHIINFEFVEIKMIDQVLSVLTHPFFGFKLVAIEDSSPEI